MNQIDPKDPFIMPMIEEQRAAEFIKVSRLIMIWVGTPVILFWSIQDYQQWGFQCFWLFFRVTFPIFTLFCFKLSTLPFFKKKGLYQVPFVIFTSHILIFCCFFISQSGGWQSRYLLGMPQIVLALSILPFGVLEFGIIFVIYSIVPIAVATDLFAAKDFFGHFSFQLYLTYSTFAALSFFVFRQAREQTFMSRSLLAREKAQQQQIIVTQAKALSEAEVTKAIAATTQMLAHDVRKPFSKMRSGLFLLANAHEPQRIRSVAQRLVPEVDKAIASVNNMLTDILEISSDASPSIECIDPEVILYRALEDVFQTHLTARVRIDSILEHDYMVCVDPLKMQRAFQNILENAVEAMNENGRIWIKTTSSTKPAHITIKIGNTGSFITAEDLSQIFDAFFTKGKRRGTGLGLAISKKIVEQHGGSIKCRSEPEIGVEFTIEIPTSSEKRASHNSYLPFRSSDYRLRIDAKQLQNMPLMSNTKDPQHSALLPSLIEKLSRCASPLKVLAVDDETIYTEYLRSLLTSDKQLGAYIEFTAVTSAAQALDIARQWSPDIAILDIDLHDPECDGYVLSQNLRHQHPNLYICIHSNRISFKDGAAAVAAGSDTFVPKPMTQIHLARFIEKLL